ncbi:Integral membrane protein [Penicillium bovifimosum]|uniref:Integral membrane protein n=1 Tax=Penicillium bovifimosum TaxID=126998 RepID=A0A9W9HAV2_9EURO|nr:Integral membrane protein [Penicillium bovifimosum]KAJ5143276.1 Integral membrane protein [Penicillium bovifimosum]
MSFTTRIPLFLLALLALTFSVQAQGATSILPSAATDKFPQCGLSCAPLTNAQSSCEAGTPASWTSCFCESALLTGLKSSGSICASCSAADQSKLSTWYNEYCVSGGKQPESPQPATTTISAASATATDASSTSSASQPFATEEKKSWWSGHYQWVIMLIVIVIGFSIIAVAGVYFKRRYDAKRPNLYHAGSTSALSASSPPAPRDSTWGPAPVPGQPGFGPGSVASSSSNVGKSSTPVAGTRTRLTKIEQGSGELEVRQV